MISDYQRQRMLAIELEYRRAFLAVVAPYIAWREQREAHAKSQGADWCRCESCESLHAAMMAYATTAEFWYRQLVLCDEHVAAYVCDCLQQAREDLVGDFTPSLTDLSDLGLHYRAELTGPAHGRTPEQIAATVRAFQDGPQTDA